MRISICLCIAVIALLAPDLAAQPTEESAPHVIVFDLSFSMGVIDAAVEDVDIEAPPPTRFERAQAGVFAFLDGEGSSQTRIGLVVFGRQTFVQAPITNDRVALRTFVEQLSLGDIDGDGAAVGDGLARALSLLQDESQDAPRAVILVTDGNENAGSISVERAAEVALEFGVPVHVVFLSGGGETALIEQSVFGPRLSRWPDAAAPAPFEALAATTGGRFVLGPTAEAVTGSLLEAVRQTLRSTVLPPPTR